MRDPDDAFDVACCDIMEYSAVTMPFNSRAFGALSKSREGQAVWALVKDPAVQANLIAAARLQRPSVEIIADELINIIPGIAKPTNPALESRQAKRTRDRLRRFAGAVVGAVMVDELGWEIDRQRVRIPATNSVFETGTTFKR
jgi:hypothetical protein